MKLLNCLKCHDMVKLVRDIRSCWCGESQGQYINDLWAEYKGPARIIGMLNPEYEESLIRPIVPYGHDYKWFPIKNGYHITKTD